jgi:hypothetical protein
MTRFAIVPCRNTGVYEASQAQVPSDSFRAHHLLQGLRTFRTLGGSIQRFVEAEDRDRQQADSQGRHGKHLGPQNLHANTFQIGSP